MEKQGSTCTSSDLIIFGFFKGFSEVLVCWFWFFSSLVFFLVGSFLCSLVPSKNSPAQPQTPERETSSPPAHKKNYPGPQPAQPQIRKTSSPTQKKQDTGSGHAQTPERMGNLKKKKAVTQYPGRHPNSNKNKLPQSPGRQTRSPTPKTNRGTQHAHHRSPPSSPSPKKAQTSGLKPTSSRISNTSEMPVEDKEAGWKEQKRRSLSPATTNAVREPIPSIVHENRYEPLATTARPPPPGSMCCWLCCWLVCWCWLVDCEDHWLLLDVRKVTCHLGLLFDEVINEIRWQLYDNTNEYIIVDLKNSTLCLSKFRPSKSLSSKPLNQTLKTPTLKLPGPNFPRPSFSIPKYFYLNLFSRDPPSPPPQDPMQRSWLLDGNECWEVEKLIFLLSIYCPSTLPMHCRKMYINCKLTM